mgnify:CR=1 FL=1
MDISEFTKHWDNKNGFTYEEALEKKEAVDEAHGVGINPKSCWNPSQIVADPLKDNGYKVIITPKNMQ